MKNNILISLAFVLPVMSSPSTAALMPFEFYGGAEFYDPAGNDFSGVPDSIQGSIEFDFENDTGSADFGQSFVSFFGNGFTFHDILLTGNADGTINFNGLMDWGSTTDIRVGLTWEIVELSGSDDPFGGTSDLGLHVVTLDGDGDGIRGNAMDNGPFPGFSMALDGMWVGMDLDGLWEPPQPYHPSPVPVPAAVWLFGSGLVGLIGFARRKKA